MLAGELAVVARLGLTGLTRTVSELQGLGFGVGLLLAWSPVKSALTCHAYQPAMVGLNEPELALQLWPAWPSVPPLSCLLASVKTGVPVQSACAAAWVANGPKSLKVTLLFEPAAPNAPVTLAVSLSETLPTLPPADGVVDRVGVNGSHVLTTSWPSWLIPSPVARLSVTPPTTTLVLACTVVVPLTSEVIWTVHWPVAPVVHEVVVPLGTKLPTLPDRMLRLTRAPGLATYPAPLPSLTKTLAVTFSMSPTWSGVC